MKKLLAVLFAAVVALSLSMTAFAQDNDHKEDAKVHKAHHHHRKHRKHVKKEKKEEKKEEKQERKS